MGTDADADERVLRDIRDSLGIPGLSFRRFRGADDFVTMSEISRESWKADGFEWSVSPEDIANALEHSKDADLRRDLVFVEVDGHVVGHGEVGWGWQDPTTTVYSHRASLLGAWRGKGIREALLRINEHRIREVARGHREARRKFFQTWAAEDPNDWRILVERAGYVQEWHLVEMVRPDLEDVPDHAVPAGLQVRRVRREDYPLVWEALCELRRDEPTFTEESCDAYHYREWLGSSTFRPELWQVAWDGATLAGMVLNRVDEEFNRSLGRKRGFTEEVFVRPPYRRKGLAKALLSRSLRMHAGLGMEEAGLDAEVRNPHMAVKLYESLGYRVVRRFTFYRKPVDAGHGGPAGDPKRGR